MKIMKPIYIIKNIIDNTYFDWYSWEVFFIEDVQDLRNWKYNSYNEAEHDLKCYVDDFNLEILEIKTIYIKTNNN